MPATANEILQEFELESVTTRRVLERVPTDQLTWKPHPKSRSLGHLALHVAIGPGLISQWALQDSMEMPRHGRAATAHFERADPGCARRQRPKGQSRGVDDW